MRSALSGAPPASIHSCRSELKSCAPAVDAKGESGVNELFASGVNVTPAGRSGVNVTTSGLAAIYFPSV